MWKTLSEWLVVLFNLAREIQEHRTLLRHLEERVRNTEEAIKLLALEQRHGREVESVQREKLLLNVQSEVTKLKELSRPRPRKDG